MNEKSQSHGEGYHGTSSSEKRKAAMEAQGAVKSSLQVSDDDAAKVAKTDKRITLADIEADVEATAYFHPAADPTVTICAVTLKNKFTVIGHSGCADPANFDEDLGKKISRENAIRQVWALKGYELCSKLATEADLKARLGGSSDEAPPVDGRG